MKKTQLLLSLFLLFCANVRAQDIAVIRFVNNDSVYDFGLITAGSEAGDELTHKFEIKNTGNAPLTITAIKSIDSNLKFDWPKKPVKPNKKALIYVTYKPKDPSAIGAFSSDVLITSNATQQPYPFMHVSGVIIPFKGTQLPVPSKDHFTIQPGYERFNGDPSVK